METVQNSEDLFQSQDAPSLRDAQGSVETVQPRNSSDQDERNQHESSGVNEAPSTVENETPDLLFSEDMDFGEHSENQKETPEQANQSTETKDPSVTTDHEGNEEDLPTDEGQVNDAVDQENTAHKSTEERLAQFPFARVKQIMKLDPDVNLITAEAVFLVTKASEMFLQTLAKDASSHTLTSKKKTMAARDVELAIDSADSLMFLEGMMKIK